MVEDEVIEIDPEFIEQAKAEMAKDPALRPCRMCFHYEHCHASKGIQHYNYGGNCFVTNEQLLRALLIQEKKRAKVQRTKFLEKLDVMNIMVGGADLIREDIMQMLTAEYRRLEIKAKTDDATYLKSKRNLERLAKCYAQMKAAMHTFESNYRQFVEYWNAQMFADESGAYSPEYDKHQHNVGFMTYLFFCMHEKLYMSEDNVRSLASFLEKMEGRDIWDEGDLKKYLIKI